LEEAEVSANLAVSRQFSASLLEVPLGAHPGADPAYHGHLQKSFCDSISTCGSGFWLSADLPAVLSKMAMVFSSVEV
jgi:hypothetical protein